MQNNLSPADVSIVFYTIQLFDLDHYTDITIASYSIAIPTETNKFQRSRSSFINVFLYKCFLYCWARSNIKCLFDFFFEQIAHRFVCVINLATRSGDQQSKQTSAQLYTTMKKKKKQQQNAFYLCNKVGATIEW